MARILLSVATRDELLVPFLLITIAEEKRVMKKLLVHSLVVASLAILLLPTVVAAQNPNNDPSLAGAQLLNPDDHTLILIDHESQMAFAVGSQPIENLRNNTVGLAKSAKLFEVDTIVTTVAERQFSGPLFPGLREVFPDTSQYIDRTTMNTWEDKRVVARVEEYGHKRLVIAGLWTEVCVVLPTISAIEDGYQVYVITDASGGVSPEAHERAIQRMVQAGAIPMTWLQYLLELHRDWARVGKYNEVNAISIEHGGGYGLGIDYIKTMQRWAKEDAE
ncbi:MAG: hydrolase [Acidobacteriota bacterium]